MVRGFFFPLLVAAPLLAAQPAGSQEISGKWRYEVHWGGFHAAQIVLTEESSPLGGKVAFRLETYGLARWLTKLRIDALGQLAAASDGPRSAAYRIEFFSRKSKTLREVAYDPAHKKPAEIKTSRKVYYNPADEEPEEEPVTPVKPELLIGVFDPETGIAKLQQLARAAHEGRGPSKFIVPIFDGKSRYDFDAEVVGPKRRMVGESTFDTLELSMVLRILGGMRAKHVKMWSDTPFQVYLLPTDDYVPLQIVNQTLWATTLVNLVERCPPSPSCVIPVEQD
jgi:hypothetical protein